MPKYSIMEKRPFSNSEPVDAIDRVDGRLKVTGAAKYAAEFQLPGITYAVLVSGTLTKGHITALDTKQAERAPGVIAVISHLNAPDVPGYVTGSNPAKPPTGGQPLRVFNSNEIFFNGQPVAMVVADTYERALYASTLVKATCQADQHQTDPEANLTRAAIPHGPRFADYTRGEADAYRGAPVKVEQQYVIPREVHNPMELHSIIALWNGADKITVYDKTQGVKATQKSIMDAFKLPEENVQVYSQFVGGAFGSGLRTWPHEIAAIMAAKKINKPVKLVLTRPQMFFMVGYRPYTTQKIGLGATPDGKLTGITHEAIAETSSYEEFTEGTVGLSRFLYACPNVTTRYRIVPLDVSTPTWMRGPGEATGSFALESAMDELAYALKLDPLELRLRNHADTDPERNQPWSSKYLKECYQVGADHIGWNKRNPVPGSMRENGWLVGYGMGTGTFSAGRSKATARAKLLANGSLIIQSAASDIGPGTGTAMVQIASDTFGIPRQQVRFDLGDSSYPQAPTQGGSATLSTVGAAVYDVCVALQQKLLELAGTNPAFKNVKPENIVFENGAIVLADHSAKMLYTDILKQQQLPAVEVVHESAAGADARKYSMYSFSVHFVKVLIHPATGVVRVNRVVSVADAGKIVSPKTASSQVIGGVVGGIGMALMEEGLIDHRYGRYVNNNLADYHVPVNADVPSIESLFIDKKDPYTNPMGSKGLGEIALVGIAAAIANAVYHATGKRIRELPITPDKLI
jgi:xanthine dehydrogenase YagR molybdenum-binding subunit